MTDDEPDEQGTSYFTCPKCLVQFTTRTWDFSLDHECVDIEEDEQ